MPDEEPNHDRDSVTHDLITALETVKQFLEMVEGYRQEILRTGYPEDLSWSMAADFHGMLFRGLNA